MAPLAQAFVRIRPQLSEAEVRTQAVRAGETAGSAMGRSMSSGVSRTFKAFAGLGAATGLVEAGRKVMEFADQFEGARARVETNTQNIGASFAAVQKPLGDLDSKMSGLGFTITDTENSFAQLITATRDPAKSLRDVALAADIARGRHVSLDEATQILMRVETGHVAMLGRLGIATRDASGHMFTQQQALEALGRAYGGNAAKFAETFAGKQAAARAEIQQSATEIGVALLPAFASLANVVAHDVLPPIAEAAQWLDRNRKTVEPLVKAILLGVAAWKSYVLWTKAAAAANVIFGRSAVSAETGVAAGAAAAGGAAAGGGAVRAAGGLLRGGAAAEVGLIGAAGVRGFAARAGAGGFGSSADLGRMPSSDKDVQAAIPIAEKLVTSHAKIVASTPALDKALTIVRARMTATTMSAHTLATAQTNVAASTQRSASQIAQAAQKLAATSSAQDQLRQAMHDAAQTAADNGRALLGNSDAALANRDAVRQQVTAVLGVIDAMKAQGRSAQAQASMLDVLTQAVETNATKTYGDKGAIDALLTSLGLVPGKAQAAASAMSAYANTQIAADAALDPKKLAGLQAQDDKTKAAAKASASKILKSFTDTFTPVVSKASVEAAKATDTAAKAAAVKAKQRFNDLRQSMLGDLQSIKDAVKSTTDALAGFGAVTNGLQGTDSLGAAMTGNVFTARKAEAAKIKQFAAAYGRLAGMGLNAADLHQFIQAGPDALPAMLQIIAAGRTGVRTENTLQRQIQSAAGRLGRQDTASQNASLIHSDLQKLPRRLALELAGELRKMHIITDAKGLDHRNGVIVAGAG